MQPKILEAIANIFRSISELFSALATNTKRTFSLKKKKKEKQIVPKPICEYEPDYKDDEDYEYQKAFARDAFL